MTAHAADQASLKWRFNSQTTELTVRRADADLAWQGDRLAEIAYWDAAGAAKWQPVAPNTGWTFESETVDKTCWVVCRQSELGFSLKINFTAAGDMLTAAVPAAEISETGTARLKTLRLLPRFGAAAEGQEGYLVIAQQSGATCRFLGKKPAEQWVSVYESICQCPMPLFGIIRGTGGLAGIVTGGQCDARVCISTAWGPQKLYAIDPGFTLRSVQQETRLSDDLAVQYHETTYSSGQRVVVN